MTFEQIQEIISNIQYKNWTVILFESPRYAIQLIWDDVCVVSGEIMQQESRMWMLDTLTEDHIVNTIFKAIQNAEEHETKERFIYKSKRIFNPHTKISKLMEVCDDNI
jgi:hypothetical protein